MKPTDKESAEYISSRHRLQKCLHCNVTASQAALWHVMNMFHIPDVDLLEQIYDSATVCLVPNDAESATITFDTGVAQKSITSPQLFNISTICCGWSRRLGRIRRSVMVCRLARTRMTAVKMPTTASSVIK